MSESESSISTHEPSADENTAADHPSAPSASAPPPTAELGDEATPTSEADAILEIIRRGLAPDADGLARAAAGDVCRRIAQLVTPPAAPAPFAPASAANVAAAVPAAATPSTPLAAIVTSLRNLPPEQVLDLAIQRLRAALPAGTTVPTPKGIHFQLVPVPPIGGAR